MKFLFDRNLLDFSVILLVSNLALNLVVIAGFIESSYLSRASQICAVGFVIAWLYVKLFERA